MLHMVEKAWQFPISVQERVEVCLCSYFTRNMTVAEILMKLVLIDFGHLGVTNKHSHIITLLW